MKFVNFCLGLVLAVSSFYFIAPTVLAAGGFGVSPSEVNITILQNDQTEIVFDLSRENFESEEIYSLSLEDENNILFPDGKEIVMAAGEQQKQFRLAVDTAGLALGDYQTNLAFEPQQGIEGADNVVVFYGISVKLAWHVVDVVGFEKHLLNDKIIHLYSARVNSDIVSGGKIFVDFNAQNSSDCMINGISYRVDLLGSDNEIIDSKVVLIDGDLTRYEDGSFHTQFRAGDPGDEKIRILALYHGGVVASQDIDLSVRAKGLHEYSVLLIQVWVLLLVLWIISIARKKKLLPLTD